MRPRDPPASPHPADDLPSLHSITRRYQHSAQTEIARHEPLPVIQIHHRTRQVEIGDEGDYTCVRGAHRSTHGPGEVGAQMAALDLAVQNAGGAETAGDPAW